MAASTWFHGSAWPPGNHGIIPFGSCHSAMASIVSWSWSEVTRPSTRGAVMRSPPPGHGHGHGPVCVA